MISKSGTLKLLLCCLITQRLTGIAAVTQGGNCQVPMSHFISITLPCCFSIHTHSSAPKMLPSEELLPFISATFCPSVYNASPAGWNFSFAHLTLHFSTLPFLPTFLLFGPLYHFSPLCSFSSRLYRSLTFTPNGVLIFFYSLILFATSSLFTFTTFFLTCNVLGLMAPNPGSGKSEMNKWGAEKQ